ELAFWAAQVQADDPPFAQVNIYPSPHPSAEGGGRCALRARSLSMIFRFFKLGVRFGRDAPNEYRGFQCLSVVRLLIPPSANR
ncbi:MAG: hypothetical protein ACRD1T_01470, partial [Acidimicrobiia bacterium]